MPDPPIACTLTPGQLNACRDDLLPGLAKRAQSIDALPDGYRLTFGGTESLQEIAKTIDRERQCCQFLRFHITIEPGGRALVVELTGARGTREFLDDLFAH